MSKRILSNQELQSKIDKFLTRKNKEMSRTDSRFRTHPTFDIKNDKFTYTY